MQAFKMFLRLALTMHHQNMMGNVSGTGWAYTYDTKANSLAPGPQ